jgi:lipopolysaccharide export LptBFGC system permease protein LptF
MYSQFCSVNNYKPLHKTEFHSKLSHVNISYKKTNGNTCYKYSVEALTEIATKFKWLHELDDVDNNDVITNDDDDDAHYENIIVQKNNEIQNLMNMIEQQRKEIEELKKQSTNISEPVITVDIGNPQDDLFATL